MINQRVLLHRLLNSDKTTLIIILDACRYDFFVKYCAKAIKSISQGSCTIEWFKKTFKGYRFFDTCYISANPYITSFKWDKYKLEAYKIFDFVYDAWLYKWNKRLKTVRAEDVNKAFERLYGLNGKYIVHYMQPHAPYIGRIKLLSQHWRHARYEMLGIETKGSEIKKYRAEIVRAAYRWNLIYVWEKCKELMRKYKDKFDIIIVTSDHGELLGENGFFHNCDQNHKKLLEVPICFIKPKLF